MPPSQLTPLRTYRLPVGRAMLWLARLGGALPIRHGVSLFRVEYGTTGTDGRPIPASGLLAVPKTDAMRGIISYQHATRADRAEVPSAPSRTEGVLASLAFGGAGYVVCAPDYVGLGRSPGWHPYLHAATEAAAVVDLLRAVREALGDQGRSVRGDLFLVGFSQGGHASLAALRSLEADPVDGLVPRAAASIAGLHALSRISFPAVLESGSTRSSAYVAYVIVAYARASGRPIDSVVASPWAERLEFLFDGSRSLADVAEALPANPRELVLPEVLADVVGERTSWFARALEENSVDDWAPKTPVRFYYGTEDVDAPPADAITTAARMSDLGADAAANAVGARDHNATAFAAVPLVRGWFEQIQSGVTVLQT